MGLTDNHSSTMDQIQALSNERYKLYQAKWLKRNQPAFRDTIKQLNRQITDLWHQHRCELAQANRTDLTVYGHRSGHVAVHGQAIAEDYFEHIGIPQPHSGYQVRDGGGWRNVDDEALTAALGRYIADIPLNEPDEFFTAPLKDVLTRRGLTLEWRRTAGGNTYGKLVSLPT